MTDRRELILSRLAALLATNSGNYRVYRNKEDLTPAMQPCFVLFDAHEERQASGEGLRTPTSGHARVRMTPRIGLYVDGLPEEIGPALNAMRIMVLRLMFPDGRSIAPTLASAIVDGVIFYDGCGNQLDRGAEMTGEMILNFSILYPLLPADFLAA